MHSYGGAVPRICLGIARRGESTPGRSRFVRFTAGTAPRVPVAWCAVRRTRMSAVPRCPKGGMRRPLQSDRRINSAISLQRPPMIPITVRCDARAAKRIRPAVRRQKPSPLLMAVLSTPTVCQRGHPSVAKPACACKHHSRVTRLIAGCAEDGHLRARLGLKG